MPPGAFPAIVSDSDLARVTAGLAKDVEAVNQYATAASLAKPWSFACLVASLAEAAGQLTHHRFRPGVRDWLL